MVVFTIIGVPQRGFAERTRDDKAALALDDAKAALRLAGAHGLEPRSTDPESVVLPIAPRPNAVSILAQVTDAAKMIAETGQSRLNLMLQG